MRRIINGPLWPQFICPNCRAVADLEADVDDPFPEQNWEELDESMDEQGEAEQNGARTTTGPALQEQPSETVGTGGNDLATNSHSRESTTGTSTEPANGVNTGLEEALNDLVLTGNEPVTAASQIESHSTVAPVDIRSGRAQSGTPGSMSVGSFNRNERTPSPNSRLLNGTEGPMTPRNDAGPFIFDGSGGRVALQPQPEVAT